jgi:4-hydroxybutyrate CoA-transferase
VAELFGRSLRERAMALLGIAHPDFREKLFQAAWERKLLPRSYPGVDLKGEDRA